MDSCLNYYIFNWFPNLKLIPFRFILHITTRFISLKHGFSYPHQFESLEVIAKAMEAIRVMKGMAWYCGVLALEPDRHGLESEINPLVMACL